MSLSRAQLAAALWGTLQRQFQEVGIENEDSTGNLKEAVDSTLLALGTEYDELETATVGSGDESKALIVARYHGLQAVYDAALSMVDTTIDAPNTSVRWSQYAANLENALTRAEAVAAPYMATVDSGWGVGSLSLDYIEPCDVEA